jgi:hypothetical protein
MKVPKKVALVSGTVLLLCVCALVFLLARTNRSTEPCSPLDSKIVAYVNGKQLDKAYQASKKVACKSPMPNNYSELSARDKELQFDSNYELAKYAYKSKDKTTAKAYANNAMSAYGSLSYTEKDNLRKSIAKLVDLNDIRDGVY